MRPVRATSLVVHALALDHSVLLGRLIAPTAQVDEAFFKGTDFAEPLLGPRFVQSLLGICGHVLNPTCLGRVDLQEPALDTCVFVYARRHEFLKCPHELIKVPC
jgi:hypothetical protein